MRPRGELLRGDRLRGPSCGPGSAPADSARAAPPRRARGARGTPLLRVPTAAAAAAPRHVAGAESGVRRALTGTRYRDRARTASASRKSSHVLRRRPRSPGCARAARDAADRRSRCRPRASSKSAIAAAQREQLLARLVAEVAALAAVEGHDAQARGSAWRSPPRPSRGSRGRRSASPKRAAEPIIAALSVQRSSETSFSRTPRRSQISAGALAQQRVRRDAAAERDGLPLAALQRTLELRRRAARRPRPESWRRGRPGAPRSSPSGEVADRVDAAPS